MTGGYRPWSKFNAHSWSFLNARRHPVGDVVDLARLAWPDRSDYSLSGLVDVLRLAHGAMPEPSDATKTILAVLLAASRQLRSKGGQVSASIGHWGRAADCVQIRLEPW